jgi:hypothetical protein
VNFFHVDIDKGMATNQLTIFQNLQSLNSTQKLSKSQLDSRIVWLLTNMVKPTHGEKATVSSLGMAKRMMKSSRSLLKDFRTSTLLMFHVQEVKKIRTAWLSTKTELCTHGELDTRANLVIMMSGTIRILQTSLFPKKLI